MIYVLLKKELDSYFSSPLAYILLALFSFVSGLIFFNLIVTYTDGIQSIPMGMAQNISFIQEVVLKLFANINFLFLFFIPLITMRLFAEEKKVGTLDLFWLAPISSVSLVVAKGLAALILVFVMLCLTLVFPVIIWGVGIHDFSSLFCDYLAVILNAASYISLGLFFSTLSSNQLVAGLLSILGIMVLWMISWGGHLTSHYMFSEIFLYIGITSHFEKILRGLISTSDLIYYVSFIFFFNFMTVKSLERRTWL